ncbi:GPI transamidase subunit PIG-U [Corchorus olitorius]|uniref:GPI transamidase subunit PIG-U n=1 Tax=Corchorus olitorius TaxID=93759 RepID=A0A1R3GZE6_9ROSI|nr:GPI transamidase subunit PIG-U [Corchorus olitorius]
MGKKKTETVPFSFWSWAVASIVLRLILIYFPKNLNLASRPEVSTPLTSFLAEGYWLKQSSMSPYAGSMYHGSPLLLSLLGPLTVKRIEGQPNHLLYSLVSVIADVVSAMLLRATGKSLQLTYFRSLESLDLVKQIRLSEILSSGDVAALIYLWNPFTIVACVGLSTSPIENMAVILCLYGACSRRVPLAAFGWVIATHLSLYPAILIIPYKSIAWKCIHQSVFSQVIFLLGCGPDAPPRKLFLQTNKEEKVLNPSKLPPAFSWRPIVHFVFWALLWSVYVLVLCGVSLRQFGGLLEMFKSTYGFILTVEDLSPNIGVLCHTASPPPLLPGFCICCHIFHAQILPISPQFSLDEDDVELLTNTFLPDIHNAPGYIGDVYSKMQFSFFLFCGYVGVSLLSPVMHNLWIWRGTGNANFYFATAMVYACLQIILVVESVSAMLNHDRKLRNLTTGKPEDAKS